MKDAKNKIDPKRVIKEKLEVLQQVILVGLLLGREMAERAAGAAVKEEFDMLWHNLVAMTGKFSKDMADLPKLKRQLTELSAAEWTEMDEWGRHVVNIPPSTIHQFADTVVDRTISLLFYLDRSKAVYGMVDKSAGQAFKNAEKKSDKVVDAPKKMLAVDAKAYAAYVEAGHLVADPEPESKDAKAKAKAEAKAKADAEAEAKAKAEAEGTPQP
jgi:hypothetical protein